MAEATIIYYTSNREKPDFKKRVQENLLKVCGGLPIISVSHKPIDLGRNICVGDVSHHPADQIFCFQNLMPLLNKKVIYIIEDVAHSRAIINAINSSKNYEIEVPEKNVRGRC